MVDQTPAARLADSIMPAPPAHRDRTTIGKADDRRTFWWCCAACCLLGLALRLIAFQLTPGPLHPDEDFQYLEQAHRLVFGTGLIPWEYIVGIRSWLLPGALAPIFAAARLFGDDPRIALWGVAIALSVLSLPTILCGMLWGNRAAGLIGAISAGVLNAAWFELAAFAPHPLADSVAASLLIPGLLLSGVGRGPPTARQSLAGGLLLGLTFVIRLQLAPVIFLAWLLSIRRGQYLRVTLGIAVPIVLAGMLDGFTLALPYQSTWFYLWVNLGMGVASGFGTSPWYIYFVVKLVFWSYGVLPLLLAIGVGSARKPILLLCAATIVVPFLLLSHKEDRFVLPALPLLMTLAGIGSAVAIQRFVKPASGTTASPRAMLITGALCGGFWLTMSLIADTGSPLWHAFYDNSELANAVNAVNADPSACGVALYPTKPWARMPGYTRLRPGIPIYGFSPGDTASQTAAFNEIIDDSRPGGDPDLATLGFSLVQCWSRETPDDWPPELRVRACVWHRPRGCDAAAAPVFAPPAQPDTHQQAKP